MQININVDKTNVLCYIHQGLRPFWNFTHCCQVVDLLVLSRNFITYPPLQNIEKTLRIPLDFRLQQYIAMSSLSPSIYWTSRERNRYLSSALPLLTLYYSSCFPPRLHFHNVNVITSSLWLDYSISHFFEGRAASLPQWLAWSRSDLFQGPKLL